jgi:hypothetical protein
MNGPSAAKLQSGPGLGVSPTYDEYIESVVAQAPPLSAQQLAKLSAQFDYDGGAPR